VDKGTSVGVLVLIETAGGIEELLLFSTDGLTIGRVVVDWLITGGVDTVGGVEELNVESVVVLVSVGVELLILVVGVEVLVSAVFVVKGVVEAF
jgi:hypothetical protein